MFKLTVLALLVVCHFTVAAAHVCDCADHVPGVSVYQWLAAGAYTVISVLFVVLLVRHLILGKPTANGGGEDEVY